MWGASANTTSKISTPVTESDTTTKFGSPSSPSYMPGGFSFGQPTSTTASVSTSANTTFTSSFATKFGSPTTLTGGFGFSQPVSTTASVSTSADTATTSSHGTPATTTANFSCGTSPSFKLPTDTTKADFNFGTSTAPKFNFGLDYSTPSMRKVVRKVVRRGEETKKRDSRNSFKVFSKSRVDTSTQTEEKFRMKKFMQGINDLFDTGKFSDVTLNVKGKEFKVHKSVLASHSPVFAAMMEHETKEKESGVVDIEDADPDIFADFLHILYSGSAEKINGENVIDLYTVADKYEVTELSTACVAYMIEHISVENFCDITALSLRHHEKELREVVLEYFLKNSIIIAETAKWLVFLKENTVAGNEMFLKALKLKKR